ncbi:hypothetical protein SFRURICE_020239 [Spodoptera frugiperda]|nr:hypothetical protein SFRURICE_020239 [Spodoptera frugiperda]
MRTRCQPSTASEALNSYFERHLFLEQKNSTASVGRIVARATAGQGDSGSIVRVGQTLPVSIVTARLARWQGNRLPRNVERVRFPHEATLCVIHKLLFQIWVSCVRDLLRITK